MDTTERIREYAEQFGQDSFTSVIERRLKQKWNPKKLQEAMRCTYAKFPVDFRGILDEYLHNYLEKWFNHLMPRQDMRIVFISTAEDLRENAPKPNEDELSDDQIIDMFNIMMMKITRIAYEDRELRKLWAIKKGWFS